MRTARLQAGLVVGLLTDFVLGCSGMGGPPQEASLAWQDAGLGLICVNPAGDLLVSDDGLKLISAKTGKTLWKLEGTGWLTTEDCDRALQVTHTYGTDREKSAQTLKVTNSADLKTGATAREKAAFAWEGPRLTAKRVQGRKILGIGTHHLMQFDLATNAIDWNTDTGRFLVSNPTMDKKSIVAGCGGGGEGNGAVCTFSRKTGKMTTTPATGSPSVQPIAGGRFAVVDRDSLRVVTFQKGKPVDLWRVSLSPVTGLTPQLFYDAPYLAVAHAKSVDVYHHDAGKLVLHHDAVDYTTPGTALGDGWLVTSARVGSVSTISAFKLGTDDDPLVLRIQKRDCERAYQCSPDRLHRNGAVSGGRALLIPTDGKIEARRLP